MDGAEEEPLPWPVLDPWPAGWLGDTPEAAVATWRRMTSARRLAIARGLLATARGALAAGIRMRHPALGDREVAGRVREEIARAGR